MRRASDDGVSLASQVFERSRGRQARTLNGIVEADETFILGSFKGRRSDLPRKARRRGGSARHPGLHQDNIPILVARDRTGATIDAVLPQDDSASIGAALTGVVTADNHLIGDGGRAIAAFARKAKIPFHAVPAPGKPLPDAPHLHLNNVMAYHGRLKQWLGRFNGVATKNSPTISAGGAPSKPGEIKSRPKLDQGRNRKRAVSTNIAISAGEVVLIFSTLSHDGTIHRQKAKSSLYWGLKQNRLGSPHPDVASARPG